MTVRGDGLRIMKKGTKEDKETLEGVRRRYYKEQCKVRSKSVLKSQRERLELGWVVKAFLRKRGKVIIDSV